MKTIYCFFMGHTFQKVDDDLEWLMIWCHKCGLYAYSHAQILYKNPNAVPITKES